MRTAVGLLVLAALAPAAAMPEEAPASAAGDQASEANPAGGGYVKPRLASFECFAARLAAADIPADVKHVTAKFVVRRDGRVDRLELLAADLSEEARERIGRAISACEWIPGKDATGHPVALWVRLPLRFREEGAESGQRGSEAD